jgi:7,8-dihydropterin-6-yl-methyl-4-(beta-D-ribofuranosyl)aminobenzene 5'-phosphate synthase
MMDDTSLILTLRDGLVVLTGCAYAGICNIINHSIELTGIKKLKAVIGGLHLVNAMRIELRGLLTASWNTTRSS